MLDVLTRWYKQKFSDPQAVTLFLLLSFASIIIIFWGSLLTPILVALVLAYLLDWPVSFLLRFGLNRTLATSIILSFFILLAVLLFLGAMPTVWQQGVTLVQEIPAMMSQARAFMLTLPEKYPEMVNAHLVESSLNTINEKLLTTGQVIFSASFTSLLNIAALIVYAILVPLMLFFMLKDKEHLLDSVMRLLPKKRLLIEKVGHEMNEQIINYVRGKVIEIIVVGVATFIAFSFMEMRYAALLAVVIGLSVLIPYIGAAAVTVPVILVGLFQWGLEPMFFYALGAHLLIQALDGNLLVPILFSEAVNLHPLAIIIAVLVFGGLWGFWGVFFAIPLATLVKAVLSSWPSTEVSSDMEAGQRAEEK